MLKLKRSFPHHVLRRLVDADVDAAHVFADESEQQHDHAAYKKQCGEHAGVAHGNFGKHEFFVDHEQARGKTNHGAEQANEGRGA